MPSASTPQVVLTERTRTIDQIKRLYAVVMGYAVTSCFTGIYACVKVIGVHNIGITLALLAQGFTFISLISLFYLGAERLLDVRYLKADSPVPSRRGLFFDLMSLGSAAAWFVVLADTFPIPPDPGFLNGPNGPAVMAAFTSQIFAVQIDFTRNLIGLYGLDLVLLIGQLFRIMAGQGSDGRSRAIGAHIFWAVLNIICIWLFIVVLPYWKGGVVDLTIFAVNALTFWLFVIHFVRFIVDFYVTFPFYYPTAPMPSSNPGP